MTHDPLASSPSDLLTDHEAAAVLGVGREQIEAMVSGRMLVATTDAAGRPAYRRADVEAVRLAGS